MISVTSAVATHPGLRREGNEDAYTVRPDLGLYVVADGMGGHAAGEVASRLAVESIESTVADTKDADLNSTWPFAYDTSLSVDGNRLKSAFYLANRQLSGAMNGDDALRGMATTAAAVLISGDAGTIAHVGDSRIYRLRGGAVSALTQDHSWVNDQVRAGKLTDDEARRHPYRNVVTKAITGGEDPDPDVLPIDLKPGDRLLLCSDGLSSVVSPEQLASLLRAPGPLSQVCQSLIDAANDAGGPDNITVVLLDVV